LTDNAGFARLEVCGVLDVVRPGIISYTVGLPYLAANSLRRALHLAADFLSGLLEVPGLSNLALHLSRGGAVSRTSLLLGSLRDHVAGRCVGHVD